MNISKSYLNRLILCLFLSVFFELTFAQIVCGKILNLEFQVSYYFTI